jgi:hypothetical protein
MAKKFLSRRVYGVEQYHVAKWLNEAKGVIAVIQIREVGAFNDNGTDAYFDILIEVDPQSALWLSSDECRHLANQHDLGPR